MPYLENDDPENMTIPFDEDDMDEPGKVIFWEFIYIFLIKPLLNYFYTPVIRLQTIYMW